MFPCITDTDFNVFRIKIFLLFAKKTLLSLGQNRTARGVQASLSTTAILMMKIIDIFFILFLTGLIANCSPIYSVSYDSDVNIDWNQISTYDWLPIPKEANINNLDAVRIKNAVNAELEAKGLMLTSISPDFLIGTQIITKEKLSVTRRSYPYYGSYKAYHRTWAADSYQYQEGTFILDFVQSASNNLIWHGAVSVTLNNADTPEKRDKLINEAMQKVLVNFPPPSN